MLRPPRDSKGLSSIAARAVGRCPEMVAPLSRKASPLLEKPPGSSGGRAEVRTTWALDTALHGERSGQRAVPRYSALISPEAVLMTVLLVKAFLALTSLPCGS